MEIQIHDIAFGGKGVGRSPEGKAVFVPFTIEGERVAIRIVREKKQFAEADLDRVIEPSPHRVTPECPYFGTCGGCTYQHIDYAHQLDLKRRQVAQALRRIGHFENIEVAPAVGSPQSYAYRNRVTVHALDGVIGYFRRDQHRLIDVEQCPIARPEVNAELAQLRTRRPRDGHYTLRAEPGPRVFSQTNDAVAELLAAHLETQMEPQRPLLIDAYCGAGFFAHRLRHKFERVIGIDWDIHAIRAATGRASESEEYRAGQVEELLAQILQREDPMAITLIVDPPATGLSGQAREILAGFAPRDLFYVSCNPSTLARDLAAMREQFSIRSVTPFDMFPQTAEIETVVHLARVNS